MQGNTQYNNELHDRSRSLPNDSLPDASSPLNASPGTTLAEKIGEIATPYLRSLDLELFDLQVTGKQVRVFIDKAEGVTLEDCARFSRLFGTALEVADVIPNHYVLEVSSPGINRPLLKKEDYTRSIGKKIKIKTHIKIMDQKVFIGRLADFNGETIYLVTDKGEEHQIPFNQVYKARIEIDCSLEQNRRD